MNKIKISIIGTVGLPPKYGGFENAVDQITKKLSGAYDITVFCSSKEYSTKPTEINNSKIKYIPLKANGIQSIIYDIISIFLSIRKNDLILSMGVSGCIILPLIKLFSKIKIITNIDGFEWKRAKWNKLAKWMLKFSEKLAVKYSDAVITDNKVITDYVKSEYGATSNLIEYGGDNVFHAKIKKNYKEYPFLNDKYALALCRIVPENKVHIILDAFKKNKEIPLVIIGTWKSSSYSRKLKEKYSDISNIFLIDSIYDQNLLNLLRSNCYIYLHTHSAGGTNPSLTEAMHLKLPIISYDINFNRETTENKALYFKDVQELSTILLNINSYSLKNIAEYMYDISSKRYRWDIIARKYSELFSSLKKDK